MSEKGPNPFVGPRPLAYGEKVYGREREIAQLRDLLISEQVLLLYSTSGAGKTSLVEAGLRPILERAGFTVLPTARVGNPPTRYSNDRLSPNRYLSSILTDLEETSESPLPAEELSTLTLAEYLTRRKNDNCVLILDQFEELFTIDPIDRAAKEECVAQLGAALEKHRHRLWLLLAMREEYIAGLDAFSQAIPGYLGTRFRLELLREQEAHWTIARSAADGGVCFAEEAVTVLVDDLRRVRVQEINGTLIEKVGEYVEPVHLQVVCRRLWQHLPPHVSEISVADVRDQGHVDEALAAYYDECVARTARESRIGERTIRNWLDQYLITPQGMRGQVLKSIDSSDGMDNIVLDRLVNDHLLRAELRRALTWYELAHDRLIEPVRDSNRRWQDMYLQAWQRTAEQWLRAGCPSSHLLTGSALADARAWSADHPDTTAAVDRDFVERSETQHRVRASELKQRRVVRGLSAMLAVSVLAVAGYHYWTWIERRPWGFVVNLSEGNVHALKGDYVLFGRETEQVTPIIALESPHIDRTHLLIDRERHVIDLRSTRGTSRNGRFLGDGEVDVEDLSDADVLVLGSVAPFRVQLVDYPWWQLWEVTSPKAPTIPGGAWGLLVDGVSKAVHYLVRDGYYIGLSDQEKIEVSEVRTNQSRMFVHRQPASEPASGAFSIEVLDGRHQVLAAFKLGDYVYRACLVPPARAFVKVAFKSLDEMHPCQGLSLRPDHAEVIHDEAQPAENLVYYLSEPGSLRVTNSFRVIPRITGLERRQ